MANLRKLSKARNATTSTPKPSFRPFIIIATFVATFAALAVILTLLFHQNTREIEIRIAPASATITIDGKTYENGVHNLPAGELSVRLEKPGFITKEYHFDTTKEQKLYDYLLQEDHTFSWYESHPEDDILLSTIGDHLADRTASSYLNANPIASKLPIVYAHYDEQYNYTEFRIDGGKYENCKSDFCLKITDTTGGNLDLAKNLLKEQGINPDSYELLYEYSPILP